MLRLRKLRALGYGAAASAAARSPPFLAMAPPLLFSSSSSAQPELQEPPASPASPDIATLDAYHERSKHSFQKYADCPSGLDWALRPDPFRRYVGATEISLRHLPPIFGSTTDPQYSRMFTEFINPSVLSKASVSQLFYDGLSLTAWRKAGPAKWNLRINPSCGNLHSTEAYVISPPLAGVTDFPFIAHYAPKDHGMEMRAEFSFELWRDLSKGFPPGTVFIGLTTVYWRQAWKYGERAFRYCHQDVGHAMGSVAMAAAAMGWDCVLLDGWGNEELDTLLGVGGRKPMPADAAKKGVYPELEQEHAQCLMALFPGRAHQESTIRGKHDFSNRSRPRDDSIYRMSNVKVPLEGLAETLSSRMAEVKWKGKPSSLSKDHVWWDVIDAAAAAAKKPTTPRVVTSKPLPQWVAFTSTYLSQTLRQIIHKRRSAIGMDSKFVLQREAFYQTMWKSMPSGYNNEIQGEQYQFPFRVLPWKTELHMAVFVHRVIGLPKGLYCLVRNTDHEELLRKAFRPEFRWEKPEKCPQHLPLYLLAEASCEKLATKIACHQDICGDSCFSIAMLSRYEVINEKGAWMYPRLFWECGVLGQMLYLEAHATGISAAGIGSYYDDPVHEILGLKDKQFQSLYHFTVGSPVEDKRMVQFPGYPDPDMAVD